jgi:hypothetical protein
MTAAPDERPVVRAAASEPPSNAAPPSPRLRKIAGVALRFALGLAVPTILYYLLRAAGVGIYVSLIASTLLSALPSLFSLVRHRRVDGLSTYFTAMMLGGLVVTLVPGSTRFLLAREAVMTAVTGLWFLTGVHGRRPLVYQFTKPFLQGRLRWPDEWDRLWDVSPRFRRMWRVASVLWAIGLLTDASLRVLFAYTLRPDLVPVLGLGLYVATLVVLNVVTNVYFVLCRVHDPRSPLRRGLD